MILASMAWAGCEALEGFSYPTTTDVNRMHDTDVVHRAELSDALADLMTKQHGEMTPAVAEALELMNEQYLSVSTELKEVAALVQAEGVDGTELAALIAVAFPGLGGLGLWMREKTKPSRSAEAVETLKTEASDAKEKMHALELILAKAAKAVDVDGIPSDG